MHRAQLGICFAVVRSMSLLTSLLLHFLTLGPTSLFNSATVPTPHIVQHLPTEGTVTSLFGNRRHPIWGVRRHHQGVDIANQRHTLIYATASGRIRRIARESGYGLVVDLDHGNGWLSRYAHLAATRLNRGDYVWPGAIIGHMGATGAVTGPHLHFELHYQGIPVDPMPYLTSLPREKSPVLAKNDQF